MAIPAEHWSFSSFHPFTDSGDVSKWVKISRVGRTNKHKNIYMYNQVFEIFREFITVNTVYILGILIMINIINDYWPYLSGKKTFFLHSMLAELSFFASDIFYAFTCYYILGFNIYTHITPTTLETLANKQTNAFHR